MWSSEKHPALEAWKRMPRTRKAKQQSIADFQRALRRLMNDHQQVRHEDIASILLFEAFLISSGLSFDPSLCRHRRSKERLR
jgi:hypothetical protein